MTIYEIAKLAGVSISTVSRVLNEKSGVREELRKKVEEVIKEQNYKPSIIAQGLTGKTMKMIGVHMPGINSYYTDRIEAINSFCKEKSYGMMITSNYKNKNDLEDDIDNLRILIEKQVDGIIYFPARITKAHIEALEEINKTIPIVLTDRDIEDLNIPCVVQDSYNGARKIMKHLIELGHKKIAFISGVYYDKSGNERFRAYKDTLEEAGIIYNEKYCKSGDYSLKSGKKAMKELIDELKEDLPSAVFAANDYLAAGAIKTLHENGIKIPEEMAITGYDNMEISEYTEPPITTIDVNQYEIGKQAVEILFKLINKEKLGISKVIMGDELIIRASTKK